MKKIIWIIGLAALALGVFGVGVVWAQDVQPPAVPGAGVNGGYGWMHDYIESALADKLGIPETDVESALASGKTMYQIALDNGVAEADIPAFFAEIHKTAFDKAVADGVLDSQRADFMLQRMSSRGYGVGACPMQNGQGGGYRFGAKGDNGLYAPGMMGRWRQAVPTAQP